MGLNSPLNRTLRMGLVGGGQGSFIGRVHAIAAQLDGRAELIAGALSSHPNVALASGPDYGLATDRTYRSWQDMLQAERNRDSGDRIDFVTIATPNNTHFEIAKAFIAMGFNVVCDKPMTTTVPEAVELAALVKEIGVVFALTHNYTGYPLIRQAKAMVASGALGEIQAIRTHYIQGWLRERLENKGQKQASWRTDPKQAGAAGCFGDIGTHAYNLMRFITGLRPNSISCSLKTCEPGRQLDDYGVALLHLQNEAIATVSASQISHGRENDLRIEIDGTKGALEWRQESPNEMWFRRNGQPHQLFTRDPNAPFTLPTSKAACRLPAGHPEGYLEGFANVYTAAFEDMVLRLDGHPHDSRKSLYPNVDDGVDGMAFIEHCVASSQQRGGRISWLHQ